MAFGNATKGYVKKHSGGGGGGGTSNYNDLSNKPQINGVTLSGNKTSEDLGISGGGTSVVSYNENVATSGSETIYDLGAKLTELGFAGNDVAIITAMPKYEDNAPNYCALYVYSDSNYNTLIRSLENRSVGLCATLTTAIQFYNTAKLKISYGGGGTNHVSLSIRIIKG